MRLGKLTAEELQRLVLDKLEGRRKEVVLSAAQGEDCAAVVADGYLLFSSDPITAAMPAKSLGSLAVSVCCNDIVSCGGEPVALLLTVIVPPSASTAEIEEIMTAAQQKACELDVDIVGGHTEFSDCVVRPIVSATAIGKTKRLMSKSALKVGDKLYVTKELGMEGTTIIADGGKEQLSEDETSIIMRYREGLDVGDEGEILRACPSVGVMHDITEGGVIGAVAEICLGARLGANIYESEFPISVLTRRLCEKYGIDPARLISSGSMLFSASSGEAVLKLKEKGIAATLIGEVTDGDVRLFKSDGTSLKVRPEPDEMYKYFERCDK
ncbi:MAG: AIR synthase [Clostridia bacterium]|nr:AIR synthase [Clostridia bacterium]